MYSVHTFNTDTGEIVFKFSDGTLYTINLIESKLTKYEGVNPTYHYFDTRLESIVKMMINRVVTIDNDGTLYRRATQPDYDKWMTKEFPNSDNAKIYNILVGTINSNIPSDYTTFESNDNDNDTNLYSIGEPDSSDDEDPYHRGNIDEFLQDVD